MEERKKRLKEMLKEKSVLKGNFKLASGKESDYYIDGRLTTLDSEGLGIIGEIFLEEIIGGGNINSVGGPSLGADPIVGSVLTHSSARGGNNSEIFRSADGGSVLKAINAVEQAGGKISMVLVVVDREEGADKKFQELGYRLISIFNISELL